MPKSPLHILKNLPLPEARQLAEPCGIGNVYEQGVPVDSARPGVTCDLLSNDFHPGTHELLRPNLPVKTALAQDFVDHVLNGIAAFRWRRYVRNPEMKPLPVYLRVSPPERCSPLYRHRRMGRSRSL